MSTIRVIYRVAPTFPATDQHPDAVRYPFTHPSLGQLYVDAVGGSPTQAEIDVKLGIDATGQALSARISTDETERQDCKLDATIMSLVNQTRTEWRTWAGTNFPTLTAAEKTRLGDLFWVVSIGVRQRVRVG